MGAASESQAAHLKRHGGGRRDCERCRYYMSKDNWMQVYGQVELPAPSRCDDRRVVQWLAERPARWPGPWGLGCVFCAHVPRRLDESTCRSAATQRFRTEWARYEVRVPTLQASNIRQHLRCAAHELSTAAYLKPDEAVEKVLQSMRQVDDALLEGDCLHYWSRWQCSENS